VGLLHPKTKEQFYAVVQLRQENKQGTAFNLVGFQTKLTYSEQKRVIRMIPGLEKAEFFRFGAIHRNTYINAPDVLSCELDLKKNNGIYFAGQIIGVEGYVESVSMGLLAALSAVKRIKGEVYSNPPVDTALGSLLKYVTENRRQSFQPMNINYGLFQVHEMKIRDKRERNKRIELKALDSLTQWMDTINGELAK
jgi:methylenetetrahydrofolate--tRNA-(uracil-5-)-methyltransferase